MTEPMIEKARGHDRRTDEPPGEGGFGLVEALIAFVILAVGLLAVAGIALSVAAQTNNAAFATDQDVAAQQVLEITATTAYSSVPTGTKDTTITVGSASYTVTRTVAQTSPRTKKVTVEVPGRGTWEPETMVTYLHMPRSQPAPPGS